MRRGAHFPDARTRRKRGQPAILKMDSTTSFYLDENPLPSVTSLTLDGQKQSRRLTSNLPTGINRLIIDIQALDDVDPANSAWPAPAGMKVENLCPPTTNAQIHQRVLCSAQQSRRTSTRGR